jgi:hypothetical protein
MDDQLDVPLEDAELLAEVELTTNLIIAATESESTLSQREIDQLLGVVAGGSDARSFPLQHIRST